MMSPGADGLRADRPGRVELALAALTLFMFTEAYLAKLLAPNAADASAADAASGFLRVLWLPFYGFILLGLIAAGRRTLETLARSPLLCLLGALALASTLWSIDPGLTFRRSVALIATTLLGVYLAARYDWLSALRLLAGMWGVLLLVTFLATLAFPGFGVMQEVHPGAWAGGWWEKNTMGGHAARAALLFAFLAWRDDPLRRIWVVASVLAVVLVGLSTSATALLGTLLGFGVLAAAAWMRQGKRFALFLVWVAGVVIGGLLIAYLLAPDAVLGLVGKDATFTGRTDIWNELLRSIAQRPLLGFGYMAYWAPDSAPRFWLVEALEWNAPSGHNGWLDLAISVGLVGVAVFAVDLCVSVTRGARLALRSPTGVLALGFFAQFLLFAMSESIILGQNSIIWATYAFFSAKLAMEARETIPRPGVRLVERPRSPVAAE